MRKCQEGTEVPAPNLASTQALTHLSEYYVECPHKIPLDVFTYLYSFLCKSIYPTRTFTFILIPSDAHLH